MTYLRDSNGRFRTSKFFGWSVIFIFVFGITWGFIVQLLEPTKIEYQTVEKIVEVDRKAPVLAKIATCESGDRHIGKSGQVFMVAEPNGTVSVGKYMINYVWFETATKMGYDLTKEVDNEAFAKYLFSEKGSEPWSKSSGHCWSK